VPSCIYVPPRAIARNPVVFERYCNFTTLGRNLPTPFLTRQSMSCNLSSVEVPSTVTGSTVTLRIEIDETRRLAGVDSPCQRFDPRHQKVRAPKHSTSLRRDGLWLYLRRSNLLFGECRLNKGPFQEWLFIAPESSSQRRFIHRIVGLLGLVPRLFLVQASQPYHPT